MAWLFRHLGQLGLATLLLGTSLLLAAKNDWAEGTADRGDGASRDYYNRAARLPWANKQGDWTDAAGKPQGEVPFGQATVTSAMSGKWIELDITKLVALWRAGTVQNQGLLLRNSQGSNTLRVASRESAEAALRPQLLIKTNKAEVSLAPAADTYLEPSTVRATGGYAEQLKISPANSALLRFDFSELPADTPINQALLRLHVIRVYGNSQSTIAAYRCSQGEYETETDPTRGLAQKFPADLGIEKHSAVIAHANFDADSWQSGWTQVAPKSQLDTVSAADSAHGFQPWRGRALRVNMAQGINTALNTLYKFEKETGSEPEAIYFRYYLRLGSDWNQTISGGKMPGISGTYGNAGWGGRKSNGSNGWSARGMFFETIPDGNPLGGLHPIGTYCYHAEMAGYYGDGWVWQQGYRGYLENDRWYCVEQYLKLNTPEKNNGVLRAWIDGRPAFEKTDIRFRTVADLRIEQIWMNIYHGGRTPSPHDQHVFIDNVVIAREYIGPMQPESAK